MVLEYCTDLFKRETAVLILEHYAEILHKVCGELEVKLNEVEMVTEKERTQILSEFNATEAEYPREKTIVELFE